MTKEEEQIVEFKIGEIVNIGSKKIMIKESLNGIGGCDGCIFHNFESYYYDAGDRDVCIGRELQDFIGSCYNDDRSDYKHIIFEEVKEDKENGK